MNRLDGKTALISGASRGIGAATAALMINAGANVIIGDILKNKGEETAKKLGSNAVFTSLNVTDEGDWSNAVELAVGKFGSLDILVNNAGLFLGRDFADISLDEWDRLASVNMTGVWLGTKVATDALAKSGAISNQGSVIVNISSVAGLVGSELDPLYSMTKGGVTLFTKSTALNFGRKGYKIRVNSVHPGVIETDMGEQTFVSRAQQHGTNDVKKSRDVALAGHPIGRLGIPEDIAKGIVFLASDDAGFMTGSALVIDGGLTAR
ncbi:MAG: glucose 1-dehydrogenase [Alphaproteobacteria bacterium]|nr:glucose 1-dehydrogenase [Alphaproteobacteria bacterium]MDG1886563.1 glucose 1-dehydrogenase [Alphaproteobacteria bacterium]|tara:strand:+ start:516 stop:1310 length:795 start_codon:yes stop_codon:yes gene_type:complete